MSVVDTSIWVPSETGNGYVNSAISGIEVSGTIKELYEAGNLTTDGRWDPSNIWCGAKGISILHSSSAPGGQESVNVIDNNNFKRNPENETEALFRYEQETRPIADPISKIRLAVIHNPLQFSAGIQAQTVTWIGGGEGPLYCSSDGSYFDDRSIMNAYIVSKFNPQKFCFCPRVQVVEVDYSDPSAIKSTTSNPLFLSELDPNSEAAYYSSNILRALQEKGYYNNIGDKKFYWVTGFVLETYSEQGGSTLRSEVSRSFCLAPIVEHTSSGAVFYTLPCHVADASNLTIYSGNQRGNYYRWDNVSENDSENITAGVDIEVSPNNGFKYGVYGCGIKMTGDYLVDYNIPSIGMGKIEQFELRTDSDLPVGTYGIMADNRDFKQLCGYMYSVSSTTSEQFGKSYRIEPFYSVNAIKRMLAGLCCYWADNYEAASGAELGPDCTSPSIHIGVMDEDGNNDGTYISGVEIADSDIGNIDDSEDSTFDPDSIPEYDFDPDYTGDSIPDWEYNAGTQTTTFLNYYYGTAEDINNFGKGLWDAPDDFWTALIKYKEMQIDPFDFLVNLRVYPFDLKEYGDVEIKDGIFVGSGGFIPFAGTNFYRATNNYRILDFGTLYLEPPVNFLNYDPYTKVSIYLPFSGTWDLNVRTLYNTPNEGDNISLKCYVDITDGTGIWVLRNEASGKNLLIKQCKIGVEITLTGNDSTQISSNIINANLNAVNRTSSFASSYASNVGSAIGNARETDIAGLLGNLGAAGNQATSGFTGTISAINDLARAGMDVPNTTGATTSSASFGINTIPYLIYRCPTVENPDNFAHTVGYLTNTTHKISELNGLTICRNVDTSGIAATESERDLIKKILESGFYA